MGIDAVVLIHQYECYLNVSLPASSGSFLVASSTSGFCLDAGPARTVLNSVNDLSTVTISCGGTETAGVFLVSCN
jgi:hypothetical protein